MHPSVVRLTGILASPSAGGDRIDWATVHPVGQSEYPADFRDFVSVYGGGTINNSFHLGLPVRVGSPLTGPEVFDDLTEEGLELAEPEESSGISWATDGHGNYMFWDTTRGEPDAWTVFRIDEFGERTDYPYAMVDFLVAFLTGVLVPQPLTLFNPETPVFLHWREEERLREAGLDLWPHLG